MNLNQLQHYASLLKFLNQVAARLIIVYCRGGKTGLCAEGWRKAVSKPLMT